MTKLPTVKVKGPFSNGYVVINERDFDPEIHEPYGEDFPVRLLPEGAKVPAEPEIGDLTREELLSRLEDAGIDPEDIERADGKEGAPLKSDLVRALEDAE